MTLFHNCAFGLIDSHWIYTHTHMLIFDLEIIHYHL